jgi:hypothetical protein
VPTPTPTLTAAERFASILLWLSHVVAARSGGDRLSFPLIALIVTRIREIKQCVARIVARIDAGSYAPRRFSAPRRPPGVRRPRPPGPLPQTFGWLLQLVPEAVGCRGQLENLFRDPEMAALLAAAPASLRRPLRSACWMLGLRPPPIPAPPRPPAPAPAPAAARKTPPPRPAPPPTRAVSGAVSGKKPPPRACGPPLPV